MCGELRSMPLLQAPAFDLARFELSRAHTLFSRTHMHQFLPQCLNSALRSHAMQHGIGR